ncbi:hypothetical protein OH799_00570 [Nocardia sp. NBC_00881]|nr:hypothetical protein OH799_00570 [Nocardia sp. NBC_00881]
MVAKAFRLESREVVARGVTDRISALECPRDITPAAPADTAGTEVA